ncbi:MAG TPA: hypothetical protein VHS99_01765 [Chloroflexota bacterium]|nr:hypothetical protein [Chloroflexota bacterium]
MSTSGARGLQRLVAPAGDGLARAPAAPPATWILYCVPGAWTDHWFDWPSAWAPWGCAFLGWTRAQWDAFERRWSTASDAARREIMAATGLYFFDWRRVPGGSLRGSTRAAARLVIDDLATLPAGADVTLLGHSKGGNVVKHVLEGVSLQVAGGASVTCPARAILVDAPVDWLRELACRLLGLGVERCQLPVGGGRVPCVTINNWLDPSGGRLPGSRNYQTLIWQDYLRPYPPHGLKGFMARRVLGDLGALPPEGAEGAQAPRGAHAPAGASDGLRGGGGVSLDGSALPLTPQPPLPQERGSI